MCRDRFQGASHVALIGTALTLVDNRPADAVRLFGFGEMVRQQLGTFYKPAQKPVIDHAVEQLRKTVSATTFDCEWASGRDMTLAGAIEFAQSATVGD